MNIKRNQVLKFIFGAGGAITLVAVLFFMSKTNNVDLETKSKISTTVTSTQQAGKNERDYLELCNKIKGMELTFDKKLSDFESAIATLMVKKSSVDGSECDKKIKEFEKILNNEIKKLETKFPALAAEKSSDSDIERSGDDGQNMENSEAALLKEEEEALAQIREELDFLDNTLYAEYADPEWSESAVSSLYEMQNDDMAEGVEVLNADCRSTFCRVDMSIDSENMEDNVRNLMEIIPWDGETYVSIDDIRTGKAVVYISREKHSLPSEASF
ncbi:MAG: hypothetical protein GY941_10600 [Planctomycetes bacterium]|nr:hypothetical protein [Planctomycetota bacterium]